MFMIPVLHILSHGGVLESTRELSCNYLVAWLLETFAFCGPNCFALITGFVCIKRTPKIKNIVKLTVQVLFYTCITTIVISIIHPEYVGIKDIIKAVFPYAYGEYWYFTSYFVMFPFIPFLNEFLNRINKKTFQKLLFVLFALFSVMQTIFYSDFCGTYQGYSGLWLTVLYIFGAYWGLYGRNMKKAKMLLIYISLTVVTLLSKIAIECMTLNALGKTIGGDYLFKYTSPTILASSVCLLIIFSQLRVSHGIIKKVIKIIVPYVFGVYLLHEEPYVREFVIKNRFSGFASINPIAMVLDVLGCALCIFLIGIVVDCLRCFLFKVLNLNALTDKTSMAISRFIQKIVGRLN